MYKVLLAEDDYDFGSLLKQYLELHDFEVAWAKDGEEAFNSFNEFAPDICVFDVMMPKMDGFTLAEKVVQQSPETPFLFLTARKMKEDKIKGLKLGADDYIVKPFEADILVLKLKNILKRKIYRPETKKETQTIKIAIGKYSFDTIRQQLDHPDTTHQLTEKEGQILLFLYKNKNVLLKREEILKAIWNSEDYFSGRSMDVFMSRIRKYFVDDNSVSLESIRGVGLEFKVTQI